MELLKAQELAIELMNEHGLINKGWFFIFDRAKRRLGSCNYRDRKITLSSNLTELRDEQNVRNTILHEIAHAIVGGRNGHNHIWRSKAIEIGCNGERCANDVKVKGKWKATCPNGHTAHRHRKPKSQSSCGACSSKFDPKYLMVYELTD
jgi:predicted SprT family Zn-dependent metalloprotease